MEHASKSACPSNCRRGGDGMRRESLRLESIGTGKHEQGTLNDFSITLYQGEILGVLSGHAAEKNDLVGIITGRLRASSGRLYLDNAPCPFEEADKLRHRKVGVVHAAKTLVDDLSIAENIFVIRKGFKAQIINSRRLNLQTQQLMDEFGLSISPRSIARNLSSVERCSIEIMKAIALGARIVILKDLSSFLSDFEVAQLLLLVKRLRDKDLGFLMVDSSIRHLSSYVDRVVVVKKGRNFWTFKHDEIDEQVMNACFPREQPAMEADDDQEVREDKPKALVFDRVCSGPLDKVSFALHQGEELCIFDRQGNGIDEIKALLSGERIAQSGRILVDGERFKANSIWQALDQRVAFVVENPADTMLFPDFTALENLCYPTSKKTADFWANPAYQASCLREYSSYFDQDTLTRYPHELSVQDIHKLIYCRWHLYNPRVVVCVKPFSSVEKSLEELSAFFISLLLKKGIAVLILTSNEAEADRPCRKISLKLKNTLLQPKNDL